MVSILIPLQLSTGSAKACRWLDVFIADSVVQLCSGNGSVSCYAKGSPAGEAQ